MSPNFKKPAKCQFCGQFKKNIHGCPQKKPANRKTFKEKPHDVCKKCGHLIMEKGKPDSCYCKEYRKVDSIVGDELDTLCRLGVPKKPAKFTIGERTGTQKKFNGKKPDKKDWKPDTTITVSKDKVYLYEGFEPMRTFSEDKAGYTYAKGYEDALKVNSGQGKLLREMYDKGFDAGKETIRKNNVKVAKLVGKIMKTIAYDRDIISDETWNILEDFIKRTL